VVWITGYQLTLAHSDALPEFPQGYGFAVNGFGSGCWSHQEREGSQVGRESGKKVDVSLCAFATCIVVICGVISTRKPTFGDRVE
jgi:hypothetical protein